MDNIKLSMTITLPGRVMLSHVEAAKKPEESFNTFHLMVEETTKKGKKINKEHMVIKTRKSIPAKQVINMSNEAFDYMISNEIPEFSTASKWKKLSKIQKLKEHLDRICASLGGIDYTYSIID